jgi:D-alanyl-lipoteichoic acid acyltransferase DltB (MBOAT superfamily)
VKELPSLLEFIGYIYFFPSFLAGPHIYFADYKRYAVTRDTHDTRHTTRTPALTPG